MKLIDEKQARQPYRIDAESISIAVRSRLVEFLGFDSLDDIGPTDAFTDLGTDSRQAVEFKLVLEAMFHCRLRTSVLFDNPTVDQLVAYLATLVGHEPIDLEIEHATGVPLPSPLLRGEGSGVRGSSLTSKLPSQFSTAQSYPLSETQRGLWYISETTEHSSSFNVPLLFKLRQPLNASKFESSLANVMQRHPALCVHIGINSDSGEIEQTVAPNWNAPRLQPIRIEPDQNLYAALRPYATQPFDFADGIPIRIYEVSHATDNYVLILFHHIIIDGLSAVPWIDELWSEYQKHDSPFESPHVNTKLPLPSPHFHGEGTTKLLLPSPLLRGEGTTELPLPSPLLRGEGSGVRGLPLDTQFFDYLAEEAEYLQPLNEIQFPIQDTEVTNSARLTSSPAINDAKYWAQLLRTCPTESGLPRSATRHDSYVNCISQVITHAQWLKLQTLATHLQTPISSILLSIYVLLLSRVSNRDDIVVTTPVSGRPGGQRGRYRDAVGCFINIIATRHAVDANQTFNQFCREVRSQFLEGIEHGQLPFSYALRSADLTITQNHRSSFPIAFTYQNIFEAWNGTLQWNNLAELDYGLYQQVEDELNLEVYDFGDSLRLNWKYQSSLFSEQTIQAWSIAFESLLDQVISAPKITLDSLGFGDYSLFDRRAETKSSPATVLDWIDQQAAKTPNAIALIDHESTWTYQQLIEASRQYADEYRDDGAREGIAIPLDAMRNAEMVARLLGIMRTGAAFMPIDRSQPRARIEAMLQSSRNGVPTGTAYVLFTSGSTGIPKAVPIQHTSLVNLCHGMIETYGLTASDCVLQFASMTFDMSIEEIFPILCIGGTVAIRDEDDIDPERLVKFTRQANVTVLNLPPSYHQALATLGVERRRQFYNSVRLVAFGGDALPQQTLEDLQTSSARIFNAYGPTEATVNATVTELTQSDEIHIGSVLPGVAMIVIDDRQRVVPFGVPGELCILGAGLSTGYLGIDSKQFCTLELNGQRVAAYRTGDQATAYLDGTLKLSGRIDHQISLRGHRIEPAEIETHINRYSGVTESVVLSIDDQLVGFVCSESNHVMDFQCLAAHLSDFLPQLMIPTAWYQVASIPTTSRGKVDRKSLRELYQNRSLLEFDLSSLNSVQHSSDSKRIVLHPPSQGGSSDSEGRIHASKTKHWPTLHQILCESLRRSSIEPSDHFLEVGGHSLLAIQVVAKINRAFGTKLTLREFLKCENFLALSSSMQQTLSSLTLDSPRGRVNEEFESKHHSDSIENLRGIKSEGCSEQQLTPSESRLWFLHQIGQTTSYVIPAMADVRGSIDIDRFKQAIRTIVDHHPTLRSNFISQAGLPVRIVRDSVTVPFAHLRCKDKQSAIEHCKEIAAIPFDLASDCLVRVVIAEYATNQSVMMICIHHIVTDAWSMQNLLRELRHVYEQGSSDGLVDLTQNYQRYRLRCASPDNLLSEQASIHWREVFEGFEDQDLHTDYERSTVLSDKGSYRSASIDKTLNQKVRSFCKEHRIILSAFWLGLVFLLLRKRGNGSDICFGIPAAGRTDLDWNDLIGFFVNTIAVRVQLTEADAISINTLEFIQQLGKNIEESLQHQSTPIEHVLEAVQPARRTDRSALFQVLFNYAAEPIRNFEFGSLRIEPLLPESETAKFELTFSMNECEDGSLLVAIEYASELFFASSIDGMLEQVTWLAEQIVAVPHASVQRLQLVRDPIQISTRAVSVKPASPLSEVLQWHAQKQPNKPAIEFNDSQVAYAELANFVTRSTTEALDSVAVLDASIDARSATITQAIHYFCGERCFTFEPRFAAAMVPPDAAYILPTSGTSGTPKGVVVSRTSLEVHNTAFVNQFTLNSCDRVAQYAHPTFDLFLEEVFPTLRAGATLVVVPEAVRLDVRALAAWTVDQAITVLDLPTSVFHAITQDAIALQSLSSSVRLLIVGGEKLNGEAASAFMQQMPNVELWNTYGPTEATIICSAHRVSLLDIAKPSIPLGDSFADADLMVVDCDGQPCPENVVGELVIAGPGLAEGYWIDGKLQQTGGFRTHTLRQHERAYWTGDLVKRGSDGLLYFVGRKDDEVKIRGQRVRLQEIRSLIADCEGVDDVAIVAWQRDSQVELIAAVKSTVPIEQVRQTASQGLMPSHIPTHWLRMEVIPLSVRGKVDRKRIIEMVQENNPSPPTPLPEDGARGVKVLAGPLPEDGTRGVKVLDARFVADNATNANDSITAQIYAVWAEVLGQSRFNCNDDFFEVGGHSLLAAQVIYRINERIQCDLKVLELFRYRTIDALAQKVAERRTNIEPAPLAPSSGREFHTNSAPLAPSSGRGAGGEGSSQNALTRKIRSHLNAQGTFIVMPGLPGLGDLYVPLAKRICNEHDVILLTMPGIDGDETCSTIAQLSDRWFNAIDWSAIKAPIHCIAHSFSGAVLYTMLRKHTELHQTLQRIVLLDTWPWKGAASLPGQDSSRYVEQLPSGLLQATKPVIDAALSMPAMQQLGLEQIAVDLVIADESRPYLSEQDWSPYFANLRTYYCPGNHFSIANPPHSNSWFKTIFQSSKKAQASHE